MIYSISSVIASDAKGFNYNTLPINPDRTLSVKFTDEQLNKIIPKNEDGSINVKLEKKQLRLIAPPDSQKVDIEQIRGINAAFSEDYDESSNSVSSLKTGPCK